MRCMHSSQAFVDICSILRDSMNACMVLPGGTIDGISCDCLGRHMLQRRTPRRLMHTPTLPQYATVL
jgi:hypothetical protein